MTGLRRGDRGSADVRVRCSPLAAWGLVGDVMRIPEWSPECFRVRWKGRADPVPGAMFAGWNRRRAAVWATTCRIDEVVPERLIAFTMVSGGEYTKWTWTVTPADDGDGTVITQTWEMLRDLPGYAVALERYLMGISDRHASLQQNIEEGLARVKSYLETSLPQ